MQILPAYPQTSFTCRQGMSHTDNIENSGLKENEIMLQFNFGSNWEWTRGPLTLAFCKTAGVRITNTAHVLLDIKVEISALNNPNKTMETTWPTLPHMCTTIIPQVPNPNPFCFMTSRFWVTEHFETSAPTDSKWPWTLSSPKFQSLSL